MEPALSWQFKLPGQRFFVAVESGHWCRSVASIDASGCAGFGDDNFREQREAWLEPLPNPECEDLAGGIFQTWNFVQIMVVQLFPQRTEGVGYRSVIHDPSHFWITLTLDNNFDLKTVSVKAVAFVGGGQELQPVGGFKLEGFSEFELHVFEMQNGMVSRPSIPFPNRSR